MLCFYWHCLFSESGLKHTESIHTFLGKGLLSRLHQHEDTILPGDEEPVSTLDHLEAQKQVKRLIQYMDNRIDKLQNLLEDEDRSVITNQKFEDLQRHIKSVSTICNLQRHIKAVSTFCNLQRHIKAVSTFCNLQRHIKAVSTFCNLIHV